METTFSFILDSGVTISTSNVTQDTNKTKTFVEPSPLPASINFTLGVVGNIIAIIVLLRVSKRHKLNIFYRLVTALIITDLFGFLAVSPIPFAVHRNFKWVGGQQVCDYMSFMLIFSGLAAVLLAGVMAMDRYLAILHPFRYNMVARHTTVNFVIIGIWLFCMFVGLLPIFGLGENVKHFPGTWCLFNFFGNTIEDNVISYLCCFLCLGAIFIMGFSNICVIRELTVGKSNNIHRVSVQKSTDVYITVFLVAMFVVFAFCWAPFCIRIVINQSHSFPRDTNADLITFRLAALNQTLDPWVYILFRRELLSRIGRFLRRYRRNRISSTESVPHVPEVTTLQL